MKTLAILLASFLSFLSLTGQVMVREGLVWTDSTWFIYQPDNVMTYTLWMEPQGMEDGHEVFNVFRTPGTEAIPTEETVTYGWAYQEEDKVYFKKASQYASGAPEEWRLMYDFGLQPGETAIVSMVGGFQLDPTNAQDQVTCVSFSPTLSTPFETMNIYDISVDHIGKLPEDHMEMHRGEWIKGIGSVLGVLNNVGFGMVTSAERTMEVRDNGVLVYSTPESKVRQVGKSGITLSISDRTITMNGLTEGLSLLVCSLDGFVELAGETTGSEMTVQLSKPGLHLVSIGMETFKISVK